MSSFKYAVLYTDGGNRTSEEVTGGGWGIHGYFFDTLPGCRYANANVILTPDGYRPKPTGDQLKDAEYNPEYSKWDYSIKLKDAGVIKDCDTVRIVDGWRGLTASAQRCELSAFLEVFESCPHKAEYYFIQADSQYLVKGFNNDLDNWIAKGWRKSDGDDVAHRDLWERILAVRTEHAGRLELKWIKAHAEHFGNECADRCATSGVIRAINNQGLDTDITWRDYIVGDARYWDVEKPIPNAIRTKWCYSFTGRATRQTEIDGINYHHYFVGDHSKSKDDVELLGKKKSDSGFGLVLTNSPVSIIERLRDYHQSKMWTTSNVMYQSEVVNMINLSNLLLPKVIWEELHGTAETMWIKNARNDLMTRREEIISKMLRPPRLSYRIEEEEELLRTVLYSHLLQQGHVIPECRDFTPLALQSLEVTDLFYTTALKKDGSAGQTKMSEFYNMTSKSVKLDLPNPCTDTLIPTIFARGIDIPTRNMMAGLADDHPRVFAVTWRFSKITFRYAFIIITDDSYGVWCGNYRNYRHLDRDQDPVKFND